MKGGSKTFCLVATFANSPFCEARRRESLALSRHYLHKYSSNARLHHHDVSWACREYCRIVVAVEDHLQMHSHMK